MEVINLNLIPNGTNPVVHASQYDEGRDFRLNLFDGTSVLTLDGTETIECDVKKPDGNIVTVAVTNTSSNYVIVTTTLQMTACSGNSLGTINISKGGVNLYTLNFVLYCERSPLENGIQSDSAIHNLETQVETIVSEQYDSANVIFDNVPTSGHGIPYVVSSDGLSSYIPKNVSDMDDVTITTPVQGEALVFDADGNLVNGTPSLDVDDLSDVTITTPTNGEILVYNNGTWENQANPSSTTNFAPDYDDAATYNTNDKVIYQGLLYVCLEDSVTGAWDGTKWQQISVADYTAELLPIQSGSATNTKDYIDSGLSGKAGTSTPTPNLTCPRCPISSFESYKIQKIGNVIFFSADLNFGATSESGVAYFSSALVDNADFVQGSLFDDLADTGYQIYKGRGGSLWIRNASTGLPASSLVNKTRMMINLIIFKAT